MSAQRVRGAALPRGEVTLAIRAAVLAELTQCGYARVSVEAVARRAGVGKAAIYRRWPSKLELVGDVIGDVLIRPEGAPAADDLRADLYGLLESFGALLSRPDLPAIMADLASEALRTPELAARITEMVGDPTRVQANEILDRAIGRGELRADLDREAALDLTMSALYWRVVVRRRTLKAGDLDRFATAITAALATL